MTGGGAATNSGIDFQQRLGALAMVAMLTEHADLGTFGIGGRGQRPSEIRFEASEAVDDLVILVGSVKIFVQAKTTLSLSAVETSEFAKVIRQFVLQHVAEPGQDDEYVLAVSGGASARITKDLRKLCAAFRLNETGVDANPLTKHEQEVLDIVNAHVDRAYRAATGGIPSDDDRTALWRHVRVAVVEVSDGESAERLAITALTASTGRDSELLWNSLVALGLTLARDRLSIDEKGLRDRVGRFLRPVKSNGLENAVELVEVGSLRAGVEVVLCRFDDEQVLLTDIRRFTADGRRRVRFVNGSVVLGDDGGPAWPLIRRTSTYERMSREITERELFPPDQTLLMAETSFDDDPNDDPFAVAHAEHLIQLFRESPSPTVCLQCSRTISEHGAYLIEIDDEDHPFEAGLVHTTCLRPLHRVLGVLKSDLYEANPALADFDFATWIAKLRSGQGVFNGMPPELRRRGRLVWNSTNGEPPVGNFGVAYDVEDGSTRYVPARGQVMRWPHALAVQAAEKMNAHIKAAEIAGDPVCSTEVSYGPYSLLVSAQTPAPAKVLAARVVELSRSTIEAHTRFADFYAPLFYLRDSATGDPVRICGAVALLTDPLQLGTMIENWAKGGSPVEDYVTVVLADDAAFDLFMHRIGVAGLHAVVDPLLGTDGSLLGGLPLDDMSQLIAGADSS